MVISSPFLSSCRRYGKNIGGANLGLRHSIDDIVQTLYIICGHSLEEYILVFNAIVCMKVGGGRV